MKQANESEMQLKLFLTHVEESYTTLSLRPQGDDTVISKTAINLCTVYNKGKEYIFGGISEVFYNEMVKKFDWRQDFVRKKHRI